METTFFSKTDKIDNPLSKILRDRQRHAQRISKIYICIRNENEDITIDTQRLKKRIRKHYE